MRRREDRGSAPSVIWCSISTERDRWTTSFTHFAAKKLQILNAICNTQIYSKGDQYVWHFHCGCRRLTPSIHSWTKRGHRSEIIYWSVGHKPPTMCCSTSLVSLSEIMEEPHRITVNASEDPRPRSPWWRGGLWTADSSSCTDLLALRCLRAEVESSVPAVVESRPKDFMSERMWGTGMPRAPNMTHTPPENWIYD